MKNIASFIKARREKAKLTQVQLAQKSGTGLRFIRELERGKSTMRCDKINQVLALFGHRLGAEQILSEDRK